MTRMIKASEVTPGMRIQWGVDDSVIQTYAKAVKRDERGARMEITTRTDAFWYIRSDIPVTVLSETLPEEPTTFGARVTAGGLRFVRGYDADWPWIDSLDGELYDWVHLCEMGPVTVIPDQGWDIPTDVDCDSEVPGRIEEWPENDTALRPYPWRDRGGYTWKWLATVSGWECYDELDDYVESGVPSYGPWDRVKDDAPEVPELIEVWPEDDEHLWAHRWKDRSGWIWKHHGEVGGGWTARRSDTSATAFTDDSRPCDGPWTIADEERL